MADSTNGRVQLLRPDGSVATVWGSPNPGPTILPKPVAVAFDAAGNGYVLDQRRGRIVVFDRARARPAGSACRARAGPAADPTALTIDPTGVIAVADAGNQRIARFTVDGGYLGSFPTPTVPRGVAVSRDGSPDLRRRQRQPHHRLRPRRAGAHQFGGVGASWARSARRPR